MLTTSEGSCRDYIKLNIWYKVLSTVLGIPHMLNRCELLSSSSTQITVEHFNNVLVPLGKGPYFLNCCWSPSQSSPHLSAASLRVMRIPAPSSLAPHRGGILPHS